MPKVVSVEESADYASVELTATLDHAGNVKQAGFYLWRDAGDKRRQEGTLAGSTLAVRWDGLEPETEYQYAVFFSNGQTEQMSNAFRFSTSELPMPGLAGVEVTPSYYDATFRVRLTGEQFLAGQCMLSWWKAGGEVRQQAPLEADGTGSLVCTVSDLLPETDYRYSITLSNGKRTQESAPASFRTLEAPYTVELSMTSVPKSSEALLSAVFTTPDGAVPAPCGFLYRESSAEEWLRVTCIPAAGRIEAEVQGLSPETDYLFCVWYTLKGEEVRSEPASFRTLEAPYTVELSMTSVPKSSETLLSAVFTTPDGAVPAPCGFLYRESSAEEWLRVTCIPAAGRIEAEVRGLSPETDYLFCVWYTLKGEEVRSEPASFRTQEAPYTVELSMTSVPKSSEALLSAVFTTPDGAVPAPCGFLYRESSAEEWLRVTCIPAAGRIEAEVQGLSPETDYLFCVWYTLKGEEVRSEPASFRTLEAPYTVELSMTSVPKSSETLLSAVFTTPDGAVPAPCGFLYREASAEEWLRVACIPAAGRIEAEVQGLSPETDYLFCVWYTLKGEEVRSDPEAFRTLVTQEPDPDPHPLPPNAFDPALLDYLLGHFDEDSDGVLTDVELSKVLELDISDILLESHDGLELLTALETLYTGDNWLARFDLRANTHLKLFSGGRSAHLQEIVFDNPELLTTYIISAPNLRGLVFSGCPRLYICQWYGVGLESVDLSRNQDLYHLDFSGTKLKELDLSACIRLKILKSENNPDLKTIWLKKGIILDSCEVEAHTEIKYK